MTVNNELSLVSLIFSPRKLTHSNFWARSKKIDLSNDKTMSKQILQRFVLFQKRLLQIYVESLRLFGKNNGLVDF